MVARSATIARHRPHFLASVSQPFGVPSVHLPALGQPLSTHIAADNAWAAGPPTTRSLVRESQLAILLTRSAVFLGDAGSSLLRDLKPFGFSSVTFSGGQIILKFLDDYPTIGFVMVFSAKRGPSGAGGQSKTIWNTQVFARPDELTNADLSRLQLLRETMMPPNLGGYQAYSWHTQGMCDADAVGKYVPTSIGIGRDRMILKVSARQSRNCWLAVFRWTNFAI